MSRGGGDSSPDASDRRIAVGRGYLWRPWLRRGQILSMPCRCSSIDQHRGHLHHDGGAGRHAPRRGRALAAVLSVSAFDFFFVPPRLSFA